MESTSSSASFVVTTDQRRNFRWVDPRFQMRYAMVLLSLVLLVSCVLVGTFWFHSEQVLNTLMNAGVLKQHSLYILIENQMGTLLWSVCAVSVLFSVFVFVMANFLSHRIVGPIFAIKRSLEKMSQGNFSDAMVTLREEDEFQDVAKLINEVCEKAKS